MQPDDVAADFLADAAASADRVDIASAFVTRRGIDHLEQWPRPDWTRLIARARHGRTDPHAIACALDELGIDVRDSAATAGSAFTPRSIFRRCRLTGPAIAMREEHAPATSSGVALKFGSSGRSPTRFSSGTRRAAVSRPTRYCAYEAQATIIISYRADSFGDAGDALDDVLQRARERDDVEIDSIQPRYAG
jgi:hypothetical protein